MATVSPSEVYRYLIEKGIPENKVLGILASIQGESGFNPLSHNKRENSVGLFQHRLSRKKGLEQFGPTPQDWRQQVDYAASEPEWQKYLQEPSSGVADDVAAFTKIFEKPADPEWRAQERMGMLPGILEQIKPGGAAASGYPLVNFPGSETRMPVSQDPAQGAQGPPQGTLPAQVGMPGQAGQAEQPVSIEQLLQQLGGAQQAEPQSKLEQWMGSPLAQMGASILAQPGNYGDWLGAIGGGVGSAIAARGESQYQQQLEQLKLQNDLKKKVAEKMLGGAGGAAGGEKIIAHDVQWNHYQELKAKEARGEVPQGTADLYFAGPKTDTTNPSDVRYEKYQQMKAEARQLQAEGKQQEADQKFADAEEYRSFSLNKEPISTRTEAAMREAEAKTFPEQLKTSEKQIMDWRSSIFAGEDLQRKIKTAYGLSESAGLESIFATLPGSDAGALFNMLGAIKGANIVDTLRSLKRESPTGASGMGGTSNLEIDALANSIEALYNTQDEEVLRAGLTDLATRTQIMLDKAKASLVKEEEFFKEMNKRSGFPRPDVGSSTPSKTYEDYHKETAGRLEAGRTSEAKPGTTGQQPIIRDYWD